MRFLLTLLAILGSWYAYLAWGLGARGGWLAALLVPFALILWIPLFYWSRYEREAEPKDSRGVRLMVWLGFTSVALLSFAFFFSALRDLGALARWALALPWPSFYGKESNLAVLGLSLAALAAGFASARWRIQVERVDVPIRGLPPEWEGATIAQLSDVHIGPTIRGEFVERLVAQVNALEPDLIALTGDLVDGLVPELRAEFARLAGLKARHGVFYVTGNHEFYWDAPQWIEEARRVGFQVLLNTHEIVRREGAPLVVAGTIDGKTDVARAIEGAPDGVPRILLAHKPSVARLAQDYGIDLQLSGHTHGGQFVPWTWVVRLVHRHVRGLHRLDHGGWIYVNRGTGYWGPPVRLGSPAEITLLKLSSRRASP